MAAAQKKVVEKKVFQLTQIVGGMYDHGYLARKGQHDRWVKLKVAKEAGYTHCVIAGKEPVGIDSAIRKAEPSARSHILDKQWEGRQKTTATRARSIREPYWDWVDAERKKLRWQKSDVGGWTLTGFPWRLDNMVLRGSRHEQFFITLKSQTHEYYVLHVPTQQTLASFNNLSGAQRFVFLAKHYWAYWEFTEVEDLTDSLKTILKSLSEGVNRMRVPWGWKRPVASPRRFDVEAEKALRYLSRTDYSYRGRSPRYAFGGKDKKQPAHRR